MNWFYWLSIAMLWLAMAANIYSFIRSMRFQKKWSKTYQDLFAELEETIDHWEREASIAREKGNRYAEMCKELAAQQDAQQEGDHDEV